MPGPGARSFWAKIMRWLPFHGPGGPTLQSPHGKCSLGVGATGRSPHRPAAFCGSRSNPPGGAPPSRCFLPRSSLPPGHNRSFQELSNSSCPPAEPGVYHSEIKIGLFSSHTGDGEIEYDDQGYRLFRPGWSREYGRGHSGGSKKGPGTAHRTSGDCFGQRRDHPEILGSPAGNGRQAGLGL